jgi:hypothetical protein
MSPLVSNATTGVGTPAVYGIVPFVAIAVG